MDLGALYYLVSAAGAVIDAIGRLVTALHAHGTPVSDATSAAVVSLKDAHAQLAASVAAPRT